MGLSVLNQPIVSSGISTASPQWVLLDSDTATTSAATRTFSNIPQTYNVLKVFALGYKSTNASNYGVYWRINNDSSTAYSFHGPLSISPPNGVRVSGAGTIDATSFGDNLRQQQRFNYELTIFNYTSTTQPKLFNTVISGVSGSNVGFSWQASGVYRPSSATSVTSIVLSGDAIETGQSENGYGLYLYGSVI